MRILILSNSDRGIYRFRKEIIAELLKEHEVVLSIPEGYYGGYFREIGCKVIPATFERHGANPIKEFKLMSTYKKILKEEKPDIVLTYTIKPNVYGGMACAGLGVPYVANITGLGTAIENGGLFQKFTLALYKMGLRKAQKVFFQNAENRDFMVNHGIVKGSYYLLPGSGVNLQENCYETYPSEDNGIGFLFVGRIMKDKGIEEFLNCAKTIHDKYPECKFDVVGGYDDENYRTLIEQYEAEGIIKYYGRQEGVHSFMKSHHVIIQPSYHEGLSNVLLEAAACGRPVIASDIPGCRETFDEDISGLGFKSRDTESLVNAVEKILSKSKEEREQMGKCGREKVEREFNRQIVIDSYLKEVDIVKNAK